MCAQGSPDPSTAADLGDRALEGDVFIGLVVPVLQQFLWALLIEAPATTSLSQPPHAWLYIGMVGILPPLVFIGGVLFGFSTAGVAGGAAYVLMALASNLLFQNPVLSVLMLLGVVLALFVYLAIKKTRGNRQPRRGPRGGLRR